MMQDKEDRRCTHNYLTKEAVKIIEKLNKISQNIQAITMGDITEEEKTY